MKHFSVFQIITLGFMLTILIGSLILMLPISTANGEGASFLDALFTATSATCVTGLIVQDTATYWSTFGQAVIITLIQIGGMGVVTMAVIITLLTGKKVSLMQRNTLKEAISAPNIGGIVRMASFIVRTSLIIELVGALLMAPVFYGEFGLLKGIWYALFHSISAFCNAGFDLMGIKEQYSSLVHFVDSPIINLTISFLIIIGGIGFLTWEDIKTHKIHIKRYRMQSKIILFVTACLILFPTLFFYFYEFSRPEWSFLSGGSRILASFFQAVTPRTAGFNTVDLLNLSEPSQFITTLLMLIGGSPGSTAGGMKTTTLAVLILSALSVFRRRGETDCFGRRIESDTLRFAASIFLMYLGLCIFGGLIISCIENLPILPCLFETASAIGTVGLTLGLTPSLGIVSKIILITLMFLGRVGCLTLVFAAASTGKPNITKLPQAKITVG